MQSKMWVYLMHLSDNMWGDPGGTLKIAPYQPKLTLDEKIWKNTIDFLPAQGFNTVLVDIGDAMQYERHPEISVEGAWSKDKLRTELNRLRTLGLTPLPKLNFSAAHDAWLGDYGKMLTTSLYYQVCRDCIEEVAEVFDNPEFFHLGMDEEEAKFQEIMALSCIRNGETWWHDLYYLFDVCESIGTRPWVWADKSWYDAELFYKKMPKSVLLSNYWYLAFSQLPDGTYDTPEVNMYCKLGEKGYDQVPCVSFFNGYVYNAQETMELGRKNIPQEHLLGYMTAPWHNPRDIAQYSLLDDAYRFGQAKKTVYPEE